MFLSSFSLDSIGHEKAIKILSLQPNDVLLNDSPLLSYLIGRNSLGPKATVYRLWIHPEVIGKLVDGEIISHPLLEPPQAFPSIQANYPKNPSLYHLSPFKTPVTPCCTLEEQSKSFP